MRLLALVVVSVSEGEDEMRSSIFGGVLRGFGGWCFFGILLRLLRGEGLGEGYKGLILIGFLEDCLWLRWFRVWNVGLCLTVESAMFDTGPVCVSLFGKFFGG